MPRLPRPLPRSFYVRPTVQVARELLGLILIHRSPAGMAAGRIVEVEAYLGQDDPASHAFRGPRGRAAVMYREGGLSYVYFSYGVHYCMNVVTDQEGVGGAVLIRALEPTSGIELMQKRRGLSDPKSLASGPGKLAQALAIGPEQNAHELWRGELTLVPGSAPRTIAVSTRIGITRAADRELRFYDPDSPHVSRKRVASHHSCVL